MNNKLKTRCKRFKYTGIDNFNTLYQSIKLFRIIKYNFEFPVMKNRKELND